MNEIIESLYRRKSVRAYETREIPEEMKNLILESAMQAPIGWLSAVIYNFGYYKSGTEGKTC